MSTEAISSLDSQIQTLKQKCDALDNSIAHATSRLAELEDGRECEGLSVSQWLAEKRACTAGLEAHRAALTEAMHTLAALGKERAELAERAHIEAITANVTSRAMACFSRLTGHLAEAKEDLEELAKCFETCEREISNRGGSTAPAAQPYVRLMSTLPGAGGPNLPIAARWLAVPGQLNS
jgi:DNA repair exonuclease SbcCD ATPase subunit